MKTPPPELLNIEDDGFNNATNVLYDWCAENFDVPRIVKVTLNFGIFIDIVKPGDGHAERLVIETNTWAGKTWTPGYTSKLLWSIPGAIFFGLSYPTTIHTSTGFHQLPIDKPIRMHISGVEIQSLGWFEFTDFSYNWRPFQKRYLTNVKTKLFNGPEVWLDQWRDKKII